MPDQHMNTGSANPTGIGAAIRRKEDLRFLLGKGNYVSDIKLPNINCDHCSLQVIQFMEEHGVNPDGRFTYHHCADLKITANPRLPIAKEWPGQGKAKGKAKKSK